jgi:hypothetical protein
VSGDAGIVCRQLLLPAAHRLIGRIVVALVMRRSLVLGVLLSHIVEQIRGILCGLK